MRMAYEHVRAHFGEMALSIFAVALGVGLVVAVRLMNAAVLAAFLDTVDAVAGRAALTVTAGEGVTFDENVVDAVSEVSGVELAVPLVRAIAFPDDGSGEFLTVHGVDLTHDAAVRVYHRARDTAEVIDDPLVFLSQPDSIVLGREFAESRGLTKESRLILVTPRGARPFTVRGILEPEGVARILKGRLVVMDLFAAEEAFTAPRQINQIDVLIKDGANIDSVRMAIQAAAPSGLVVEEPRLRKDVIRKTVSGFQGMLTGFGLVAILVGFFISYSRLAAIFAKRTWEIGLLRSIGLSRTVVFGELLKESLLLGAAGSAVGIPLGLATARYGLPLVARATAANFGTVEVLTTLAIDFGAIAWGGLVGLAAAILSAVIPAVRMARMQPIAALRMRGREEPPEKPLLALYCAVGLLAASGVLLILQLLLRVAWPGMFVTAFIGLAAGAAAPPVVDFGGRLLRPSWGRMFGPTGEFAAGQIVEARGRVALTVATLGIGLGAVVMFGTIAWSFERSLVEQMTTRLRSDLVVSSMFRSAGWITAPVGEEIVSEIAAVPGVDTIAAAQVKGIIYQGSPILLYGYDAPCLKDGAVCEWSLTGNTLPDALGMVARGEGAIVSPSFVTTFGVRAGDALTLESPSGPQRFVVAGTTTTMTDTALMVSRSRLREAWKDRHVTWTYVKVDDPTAKSAVARALARQIGQKYRVQVQSVAELIEDLAGQVHDAFRVVYLMEGITLLLVLVAVGDLLATSVMEHTRELATMRVLGLTRASLFAMVIQEGIIVGVFGIALAAATGLILGAFWVDIEFPAILGWSFQLHVAPRLLVTVVVATGVLCIVGSLLPAWRAARLPVGMALRNE